MRKRGQDKKNKNGNKFERREAKTERRKRRIKSKEENPHGCDGKKCSKQIERQKKRYICLGKGKTKLKRNRF